MAEGFVKITVKPDDEFFVVKANAEGFSVVAGNSIGETPAVTKAAPDPAPPPISAAPGAATIE